MLHPSLHGDLAHQHQRELERSAERAAGLRLAGFEIDFARGSPDAHDGGS